MPIMAEPNLKTACLGGADIPSANTLETMHHSPYILHARGGRLSEVPVEKVLLPSDRETSPQAIQLVKASDSSSQAGNSWEAVRNNTDFYAIRWRPVE